MTDWTFCKAGETLLGEINDAFPDRSVETDGTIGDASHQAGLSDHNPNEQNVVTAWDVTTQSWSNAFAVALAESNDPRLKYVIWNRHIWSLERTSEGWRQYEGKDPHIDHIHISFSADPKQYSRTDPWDIFPPKEEDEMSPAEKALLQETHDLLLELMGPRRADHKDMNPRRFSLGDLYTRVEALESAILDRMPAKSP